MSWQSTGRFEMQMCGAFKFRKTAVGPDQRGRKEGSDSQWMLGEESWARDGEAMLLALFKPCVVKDDKLYFQSVVD